MSKSPLQLHRDLYVRRLNDAHISPTRNEANRRRDERIRWLDREILRLVVARDRLLMEGEK